MDSAPSHRNVASPRVGLRDHWTPRALCYLVLAVIGLVATFGLNISAVVERRDFFRDWVNSGPAVSSLTIDLLVVAIAGSILIVLEARRLRMTRGWLYVVVAGLTAFAFAFPLFLAMRERVLEAGRAETGRDTPERT